MASGAETTAAAFVAARREGRALAAFPGTFPEDLAEAYAILNREIELWPDRLAGWKIGRLSPDLATLHGFDRFIGPIFARTIEPARADGPTPFPMIPGGFAAFEAEIVVTLAADADPARIAWSLADAHALIGEMRIAVEVAGNSLTTINQLGSLANIAGFGNNMGLILGDTIEAWRDLPDERLTCRSIIDNVEIGQGRAADLPGGLLTGLAYALGKAAELGLPMRAGMAISTGALTGVHPVRDGQHCLADFGDLGQIACAVTAA